MLRTLRKILLLILLLVALLIVAAPMAGYLYVAQSITIQPPKEPEISVAYEAVMLVWNKTESCTPAQCSKVTPYWLYRWLVVALISDNIKEINLEYVQGDVSIMCSHIARHHMSFNRLKYRSMLSWHISEALIGIYIQRNWSAVQIVAKYQAISA